MAVFWLPLRILDFWKQFKTVFTATSSQAALVAAFKFLVAKKFLGDIFSSQHFYVQHSGPLAESEKLILVGEKTTLSIVSFQFENRRDNCWSLKQLFLLQKQIYCPSLWPTPQTILHSSNFFVLFCNYRVKTYLRQCLLLPSLRCVFYLIFHQSTFQT